MSKAKPDQGHLLVATTDYEALYQPTYINVNGANWEKFGYGLIGCSTVIMILQAVKVGPDLIWKRADDVTTVLFTFELLVRVFEKGYLFFTEEQKNWNFFDSLVVAISLFSMVLSANVSQETTKGGSGAGSSNNAAMNKMKALRTLRLLRLLRLFRVFRGIEKVNQFVDLLLNSVGVIFLALIIITAFATLLCTVIVATWASGKAWLRTHSLPQFPEIN